MSMFVRRTFRNGLGDSTLQLVSSQPTCPAGYTIDLNNQCQSPTTSSTLMSLFMFPSQLIGVSTNENVAAPYISGAIWLAAAILLFSGGGR